MLVKPIQLCRTALSSRRIECTLIGLAIVALIAASCGKVSAPVITPPGGQVDASLVSMRVARGYGIDANDNGIVDMPNRVAYVQRPLEVTFDAKGLANFYPSRWPIGEGESPGLGNLNGPWRWTFVPVSVRQNVGNLPIPTSRVQNVSASNDGSKLVAFTGAPTLAIDLFEGEWDIELARANPDDPAGGAIYWKTVRLTIEDYLIVQLGDSYSTGEGAPERLGLDGFWGDDGTVDDYLISDPDYGACLTRDEVWDDIDIDEVLDDYLDCIWERAYGTEVNFEHELAHRSSKTWGSLAAMAVEEYDAQSSVTFINLAASGARIKHLTQAYQNPIPPNPNSLPEVLDYFSDLGSAMHRPLPPQLVQLRELVGEREVDAVVVSLGGNDVGFGSAIFAYMLRDPGNVAIGPDFDAIEEALWTGHWDSLDSAFAAVTDFFGLSDMRAEVLGFTGLPDGYRDMADALESAGLDPEVVYITEYPDPLVTDNMYIQDHQNAEVCPDAIFTNPGNTLGLEIGRKEQRHARQHLIIPLNEKIAYHADVAGWNLLGDVARIMYGDPICDEDDRMVNRYKESGERQGDHNGALHPNEAGYQAIAEQLLRVWRLPNTVRTEGDLWDELRGPEEAYLVRPNPRIHRIVELGPVDPEITPELPRWGSYGLEFPPERVFLKVFPGWCGEGEKLKVDMRPAEDYEYQTSTDRYWVDLLPPMPHPFLRLVEREENDPEQWKVRAVLRGYGTLSYDFSQVDPSGKTYHILLTTEENTVSEPVGGAPVKGYSTYNNEWGAVQLRSRCEP